MRSKTSDPVYIQITTLSAIGNYLQTEKGKKLGITDPRKAVQYILTKFLEEE